MTSRTTRRGFSGRGAVRVDAGSPRLSATGLGERVDHPAGPRGAPYDLKQAERRCGRDTEERPAAHRGQIALHQHQHRAHRQRREQDERVLVHPMGHHEGRPRQSDWPAGRPQYDNCVQRDDRHGRQVANRHSSNLPACRDLPFPSVPVPATSQEAQGARRVLVRSQTEPPPARNSQRTQRPIALESMLNDRAIGYRLNTIEQMLGRPVRARQIELQAAIRLERVLGKP